MTSRPIHRRGFTLLELMLTLTLFSAVMSLMLNAFFQFNDQDRRLTDRLELRQEMRVLEQLIREDLQAAVFLKSYVADPLREQEGRRSGLLGENRQLGTRDGDHLHLHVNRPSRFYRTLAAEHDPELHEVSYYLEPTDGETALLKRRESYYIDPDIQESIDNRVYTLSENVTALNFVYYADGTAEPPDEWDSSLRKTGRGEYQGLPVGMAVTLELQNPAGETWRSTFQVNLKPAMGGFVQWD